MEIMYTTLCMLVDCGYLVEGFTHKSPLGCGLTETSSERNPARTGFRRPLILNSYLVDRGKISAFLANKFSPVIWHRQSLELRRKVPVL